MDINASWSEPIRLRKSKASGLFNQINLESLPAEPGVYVFARKYGNKLIPIYIGETLSIYHRIKTHMNSLALMTAIKDASNGARILIYCTVDTNNRDKAKKYIKIIENALIIHSQSEGHELFNKMGMKRPTDSVHFSGNTLSKTIAPNTMRIRQALTRHKKK